MSADEYLLTTVIDFSDRAEGQVLCRGTREECEKLSALMPAIMVSGEAPTRARHLIVPAKDFPDIPVGTPWKARRPAGGVH
ncbi:MAG: hypothetical protein KBG29_13855 [Pseudomonadales bacterium]|jgi:hypothetical protein|nr:hypothetical protein [Pseudomonadales bacterium]